MKIRHSKSAIIVENKSKPKYKYISCKNIKKISLSNLSKNNDISPIKKKEEFTSQKIQNSSMSFNFSFNELYKNKENFDNCNINKKILISKTQYSKIITDINEIDTKYINNNNLIEKLKKELEALKQEKKQKESDIVNLLSNKESFEEVYKIKISSLISDNKEFNNKKINGKKKIGNIDSSNDENQFSTINILLENDDIEINLDDLKVIDKKLLEDQLINLAYDILQKKDVEIRNKLLQKIKIGYQVLFSQINSEKKIEDNIIISNFFSRISIFLTNINRGKYPQSLISSFLKILVKINSINIKISEIIKFLNKNYKDKKSELRDKIIRLTEKNENLKNKRKKYEEKKLEFKKFIDENIPKIKINEKNKIFTNNENKGCLSYLIDNNFPDELDFLNEDKTYEILDKKNMNNTNITHIENRNNIPKCLNIKSKSNLNSMKNINKANDILINNNSKKNIIKRSKRIGRNKILNMSNFKMNNKLNENFNGIIEKKETQLISQINSFSINKNPFNNTNKTSLYENNEKNITTNKTINSINVNNLIINNNLNIENNNNNSRLIHSTNNTIENKRRLIYNNSSKINSINQFSKANIEGYSKRSYKSRYNNEENQEQQNNKKILRLKGIHNNNSLNNIFTPKKTNILFSQKNLQNSDQKIRLLFPKNSGFFYNKSRSPLHQRTLYSSNLNQNSIDNLFNHITKDMSESLCYFKILDKNYSGINPFNINEGNIKKMNYFEGSVLMDKLFNKLKILQKREKKYIGIELKDIVDINLGKQMENIIKIYKIYLKIGKNQKNFDINKFISTKEITDIRMHQYEKINAIKCKYFVFSIIMKKRFIPKVEFIFYNYEDFNMWYNCLNSVVKLNCPDKDKK